MEASAFRAPAALAPRRPGGVLLRLRTDEQLVALFRQGNGDAFRVIHDRYRQRLSAYARQMLGGSWTDADDAMQDVFLRAYGALSADDRPVTLRAWLYRVAHNRCIDHLRRPASQPTDELLEGSHTLTAPTGDPIVAAESREALRCLVVDVRALPEQQRSALLMREMEGLSYVELAAALQVTVPAVKSLLVRARMGLVESQQARDTPCQEIREDITIAYDRGVRASGRARRHARECAGCAGFRTTLKGMSADLGALSPAVGPWGTLLKLVGLGAGGSGAAGGAAAVGGGASAVGSGAATGTLAIGASAATKLAAVVCCAAVFGGGVEVARQAAAPTAHRTPHAASSSSAASAAASAPGTPGGLPTRASAPAERFLATGGASLRRAPAAAPAPLTPHPVAIASPILTAPDPYLLPADALGSFKDPVPADGGVEAPPEGQPLDDATSGHPSGAGTDGDAANAGPGTTTGSGTTGSAPSTTATTGSATGTTGMGATAATTATPAPTGAATGGSAPDPRGGDATPGTPAGRAPTP